MATLKIKFADGTGEDIENAFSVIDHGDGEISYFIGGGFTRYHAMKVAEHQLVNGVDAADI